MNNLMPDFLSHYYEASRGPSRNLSDLLLEEAQEILHRIQEKGGTLKHKYGMMNQLDLFDDQPLMVAKR